MSYELVLTDLEDLRKWVKELTVISQESDLHTIRFKIVMFKIDLNVHLKLEETEFVKREKIRFLRGFEIIKDPVKFKEIYSFIAKHFYSTEFDNETLNEFFDVYIKDDPHTLSLNIEFNLGSLHLDEELWETVIEKINEGIIQI